jgi:hypothetical protein
MKKSIFIIPIYKRIELAKMCVERLIEQGNRLNFEVAIIGVLEDVEQIKCVNKIITNFDFTVAEKLNIAISHYSPNYKKTTIWGSDNFASDKAIEKLLNSKKSIVGFDKIYFYSTHDKKSYLWKSNKMTIGVGRTYQKSVLEKYNFKLYDDNLNRGLDTNAWNKYKKDYKETFLKIGKDWILDVKHEQNITSHDIFKVCEEVEKVWNISFDHLIPIDQKNTNKQNKKLNKYCWLKKY